LRGGFICRADLHPLFTINTCQRKRLRLQELALLPGSGSRKAAGGVLWFSETTHIALGRLSLLSTTRIYSQELPIKVVNRLFPTSSIIVTN
jgi:hypothetical protein